MKRTAAQSKRLYALLSKLGIDAETKSELIYNYTQGRTIHSSELTIDECDKLIRQLQQIYQDSEAYRNHRILNNTRWKLIYSLRDKGMCTDDGKPDFQRIHDYCIHYWHKHINDMTIDELNKYIGIVRKWSKLKKIKYATD